jgi:tetratricopeptide (TPR) repeat protein
MVVIAVGFSAGSIITSAEFFKERLRRESTQEEIVVGKWLGETFPENTSILNDPYAYVPEKFQFVMGSIGMTYGIVCHFEPDLLLVRDAIVSDYAKKEKADVARMGKDPFLERFFFYRFLQEGLIPTYRLYRDFGQIAVYQRTAPSTRPDHVTWRELMDKYIENRRYGMVADYWTMGFIHLTKGDTIEAKNAFEKARQGQNFNTRVFQHGIAMLALGQVDAARHAFRAALQASEDQPVVYRAKLRDELAIRFFQAGLYADARAIAEQALALNGQLPRSLFTQAVACVALGDIQMGDMLLEQAVLRFGKDPTGAPLLDWLISHGVQEQAAKNLREKYF